MERGKFYIIRHGQTDWNKVYKLQGRTDIELNENGKNMAREAREKYKDIDIDVCYSSPLKRAYETAEIIFGDRNIPIIKDDRLMEMCFGKYEGAVKVMETPGHPMGVFFRDPVNYHADESGESYEQLYERTRGFIDEVLLPELEAGKNVVVVGHGAMNLSIINQLKNIPLKDFWNYFQGNCELVEVDFKE